MEILWVLVAVLMGLWAVGLVTRMAGGLIHLLLLIALVVIAYNVLRGMQA